MTSAFATSSASVPASIANYSQSKDYAVGLLLEYPLAGNFSLEGDALYRELHLITGSRGPHGGSISPVVTWELPLMLKYRLPVAGANPFIEAGPAFRPTTNLNANPSHYGLTAGIGVAARWRKFEIEPMVRYSRWVRDRPLGNLAESESNQVELLVGVSSHPRSVWHPLSPRIALGVIAGSTLFHDVPASSYTLTSSQIPAAISSTGQVESARMFFSGSDVSLMGPALEATLLKHLSLEADAFYHPIDCSRRGVLNSGQVFGSFSGAEGRTWEFPVLGKYKIGGGRVQSFVEAGPAFRLLAENSSVLGISAGAGVETHVRAVKIAPTLRFTHWGRQGRHDPFDTVVLNQLEFLTSIVL